MKKYLLFLAIAELFMASVAPQAFGFQNQGSDSISHNTLEATNLHSTIAISVIKKSKPEQIPATTIDQLLKGRVAGVQVTQKSGAPGSSAIIQIRGINTIDAKALPVYILDGIPYDQALTFRNLNTGNGNFTGSGNLLPDRNILTDIQANPLTFINPQDIEQIEIIKDAAGTALYGGRGTNGVIIITTKRGQPGQHFTLNSTAGVQQISKKLPLLNATQYARIVNAGAAQNNEPTIYTEAQINSFGQGTDWQYEIYRIAFQQTHQLAYAGGSTKHRVYASANYLNQQGIMVNSGFNRSGFRLNYDGQLLKNLKLTLSSVLSYTNTQPASETRNQEITRATLYMPPVWPAKKGNYNSSGNYQNRTLFHSNPINLADQNPEQNSHLLLGRLGLEYLLLKNITIKLTYGKEKIRQEATYSGPYSATTSAVGITTTDYTEHLANTDRNKTTIGEANVGYHKNWEQKHDLYLSGGYTTQITEIATQQDSELFAAQPPNNYYSFFTASNLFRDTLNSFLAQFRYSYLNRYFVSASWRREVNSWFIPENQTAVFPAFSVAWIARRTNDATRLSNLGQVRIRAGYGQTGNYRISPASNAWIEPKLTPEITTQWNIGTDITLLKDKLLLNLDYYQKKHDNLFLTISLPDIWSGGMFNTRTKPYISNGASMKNKGIEFTAITKILTSALTWNSTFTFSLNRNALTEVDQELLKLSAFKSFNSDQIGNSISSIYGPIFTGLHQAGDKLPNGSPATPGTYAYAKDPKDPATLLYPKIGDYQPDFLYSLDQDFSYKKWELNLFLHGVQGNDINNSLGNNLKTFMGNNASTEVLNYWTSTNTRTIVPRLNTENFSSQVTASNTIEEGSFLRLRNLTIAYNVKLPLSLTDKNIETKIYLTGQNLLTFTNYSGYDPEVGGNQQMPGIDYGQYPTARTYLGGVKFSF